MDGVYYYSLVAHRCNAGADLVADCQNNVTKHTNWDVMRLNLTGG